MSLRGSRASLAAEFRLWNVDIANSTRTSTAGPSGFYGQLLRIDTRTSSRSLSAARTLPAGRPPAKGSEGTVAKTNLIATCKMVCVYCRTADTSSPKSLHAKVRREAAERMVGDHRARWVLPDAIQRTELTSEVVSDQPTITDSECEINAGAYAGLRRGAAATLSAAQVEAVRLKVAVWPEIYDQKAPLPGCCRNSDLCNTVRGVTLMSRDELQKLSDLQVAFVGSEAQLPSRLLRRNRMPVMGEDYVLQHYRDDESEPESERSCRVSRTRR